MKTVILIPRRNGIPERDASWAWCRARHEATLPEFQVYEGHHDVGPFNRSAALNLASRLADEGGPWDYAIIVDSDVMLDPDRIRESVELAERTGKVVWSFGWWAGMREGPTRELLAGEIDPDELIGRINAIHAAGTPNRMGHTPVPGSLPPEFEKVNPVSWSCCFVVPRAAWDRLGGFDERFSGWGFEDMAWQSAACGLVGHERLPGAVVHLWHPRSPGLGEDGVNKRRNRQLGRRYMYALRVMGMHDRTTPADAEEMERDRQHLRNLALTEESDRYGRPAADLPDWRDWWPPLEELVASWKERRAPGPPPRISLIVRSGGTMAAWPARREYLVESLASIGRHLRGGTIVRKVVRSDWPPEVTSELEAIAERYGFYVVGSGNLGLTASMGALWRYLAGRKDPFDFVFLTEDDFRLERDVDLDRLARVLDANPHLVQVALLRDACYPRERELGGILGHPLDEFDFRRDGPDAWLEHRRFFTLNPSLIRRSLTGTPWPTVQHSETAFGNRVFRDPAAKSALWGEGEAWVTHLGEVRAGIGY